MTHHFDPAAYAGISLYQTRKQVSDEIERMIAFLDSLDSDPDLEDGHDDEESLGWTISHGPCTAHAFIAMPRQWIDLEGDEHDGREPDVCGESWLGWTNATNQESGPHRDGGGWGVGLDCEYDPADCGEVEQLPEPRTT